MKKSDLKQLIKPLVKECIHEVLLEEGLLSNIVSEVAKGMQGSLIVEAKPQQKRPKALFSEERAVKRKAVDTMEQRRKLMEAIGSDAYNGVNLFEGTEALSRYEAATPKAGSVDLGSPADAGVDISSLIPDASRLWGAMK
jgi:hypothetical protein